MALVQTVYMSIASARESGEAHAIGELVIGGDWACAHGDFGTLHFIVAKLADHAWPSLRKRLLDCANACYDDPDRAAVEWATLRTRCFDPQ
jgi:hypothetical protein